MKLNRIVPTLALVAALTITLGACSAANNGGGPTASPNAANATLTLNPTEDIPSFDPAQAVSSELLEYDQAVYDSLVRTEANGKLVPMLATKWSYNAAQTVLTMTIRKGVKFTDGTPLNAAAVEYNLDRGRAATSAIASTLASVSGVTSPNSTTVVLTLSAPDPSLLYNFGYLSSFIASPTAIKAGKIATHPVGSGPYELDSATSVAGSSYTFPRNKNYWSPDLQKFGEIVLKPITDPTASLNALVSGQVDASSISTTSVAQAKAAGLIEHQTSPIVYTLFILDRTGKVVPALANPDVRQAINYALDKDALVKQVFGGYGVPTSQIFPTSTAPYDASLSSHYSLNVEKAKQLMAKAGYANGFTVSMPEIAGAFPSALIAGLGQELKDIGITVNWVNVAPTDFVPDVQAGKFPMAFFEPAYKPGNMGMINYLVSENAPYNAFHTTNATVAGLIHTIQFDPSQATAAGQKLNRYIVDQAWFAPIAVGVETYFTTKAVTVTMNPLLTSPAIYDFTPAK